jgi:sortase B
MAMYDEVLKTPASTEKRVKKSFKERFIPLKTDSKNELINKFILIGSFLALIACAAVLFVYFLHNFQAKANVENLSEIYAAANARVISASEISGNSTPGVNQNSQSNDMPVTTVPAPDEPWVEPPLLPSAKIMLDINPEYAAYISIPGVFSEAVVLSADNDFYLTHNYYKQKRAVGTVFADYRNVINGADVSDNIVLYGHNNSDGTMFGNLDYYKYNYNYWLKNPFVYFDNYYTQDVYVIIASFITNVEPEHDNGKVFDYQNYLNFTDTEPYTFDTFKKTVLEKTAFLTGLEFDENDQYLTLSTCSYEWEPSRHVMICRKLRPGETTSNIDTTKFQNNPDMIWPAIYYKYAG